MNISRHWRAFAAAMVLIGSTTLACANQMPGELVSGQVTGVAGDSAIKIDGKTYRIKSGSLAADAARTLRPGQIIDAQLNGPANSAATEVINLVARGNR